MINILLYLIIRYVALFPVALIPGLSWAVFGAMATSLFAYFKPVGADYVFTPIALAYIYWTAYRRDGWGGLISAVGGSMLGLAGAPIAGPVLVEVLASAIFVFWYALIVIFDTALDFINAVAMFAFWAGLSAGLIFVLSILLGLLAGFVAGMLLNGYSMYVSFVTSASRQLIHKMLHNLPPGVMALAALPVSTFFAATEVFVALSLLFIAANYSLGFLAGSYLLSVQWAIVFFFIPGVSVIGAIKAATDVGAHIIGMLMSRAWHRLEGSAVSPGVMFAAMVAYAAKFLSPASTFALAYALLLSRRRGHEAYTWLAASLMASAFFYIINVVPYAWFFIGGIPMPIIGPP